MKQLCQNTQFIFHSNENLMGVMISYLKCKDIVSLSQVNKLYRKVTKNYDYYFKEVSYNFFFSQYETYNIDDQLNCSDIVSSTQILEEKQKDSIDETSIPSVYTWKGLFGIGVYIKDSWLSNSYQKPYLNDLKQMSDFLYSNLKECEILPRLRKQNQIVEGEFNSPFQTFLYDFLYEQQDLYDEYDCKMAEYKTKPLRCRKADLPFCDLICKFKSLIQTIDTTDKIETLKKLRWYKWFDNKTIITFKKQQPLSQNQVSDWSNDNNSFISSSSDIIMNDFIDDELAVFNNLAFEKKIKDNQNISSCCSCLIEGDPIELNKDLVNKMLQNETNPLFFVINCICLTMTFYCQYAMNYLFLSFTKDSDILNEYIKIYKNYIDTAIGFNDYCENVNVGLNYCYEEIWKDQLAFPKFSIFRLLILTWNRELTNRLNKNDTTMLGSLKNSLLSIVSKSLNEFNEKAQIKSNCDVRQSKDIEECSIEESISTKYSSIFQSESINQLNPMSIDDCLQEEESINTSIMEQGLSVLSDTFCDEYSVFSMNLSHFEVNSFYNNIEDSVISKIESMIKEYYQIKVYNQSIQAKAAIDSILEYFTSNTYSSKIITQFKKRIYKAIQFVLIQILNADMENDINHYISSNKLVITKEFKANTYFELHPNTMHNDKVYQTLIGYLSSSTIPSIVKEYCVVRYLKETSKQATSYCSLINQVNDWMTEEQEKFVYKNKRVANEVKRKNIQEYNKYQKEILSYCWRPNWGIIAKANAIAQEKQHALDLPNYHFNSIISSINRNDLALSLKLV